MAGWISSKLKVAETFLQQIDQQAAESLGKNEKNQHDDIKHEAPAKAETVLPLKDQLKRRASQEINEISSSSLTKDSVFNEGKRKVVMPPPPPKQYSLDSKPMPALTDSDWTELLSGPKQPSPSGAIRSNGLGSIRGHLKDMKKSLEAKKPTQRRSNGSGHKSTERSGIGSTGGGAMSVKRSDGEESGSGDSTQMRSGSEAADDDVYVGKMGKSILEKNVGQMGDGITAIESLSVAPEVDGATEGKKQVDGNFEQLRIEKPDLVARSSTTYMRSSSSDVETSGSDSDSSSSSESESERLRKAERARRKERIMAEKAAAKAIEAIKDYENMVARLEGEKQSLEKILEERSREQAQEASELQMNMMQTMNAVELEKQKHNTTRMEALTRLAKLETSNADLARSLAATQWNLEIEVNRVTDLRQELELKEVIHEELMKKISEIQQSKSSPNQMEASKGVEFEREILEAEYSFTCDEVKHLQDKAKKLEENIESIRKEMEDPTEVEVELKRRLGQLTDHLIQKQAQVEALSSEKATLLFRIETVSQLLEEQKSSQQLSDLAGPSSRDDLEAGNWEVSNSKLRPVLSDRLQSGSLHFKLLLHQLNSLYCAGSALLRRNPAAKFWSLFYFVCLHFWVAYILISDSKASDAVSGAVVSLETINKTTGS